jgi:hypothetical protein
MAAPKLTRRSISWQWLGYPRYFHSSPDMKDDPAPSPANTHGIEQMDEAQTAPKLIIAPADATTPLPTERRFGARGFKTGAARTGAFIGQES